MKKLLLSAGLTAATILISAAANAQDTTDATRERQLEAYRAYVAAQGTKPTEAGQATLAAGNTNTPPAAATTPVNGTTTVEKTTTKTYDVSTRKVGLVGGRPFPARTETVDGGEVKEVTVDGMQTETDVVKPDPMAGQTDKPATGNYFTGPRGVTAYEGTAKQPNSNLGVHYTGSFND
jgi:hypothetical protein